MWSQKAVFEKGNLLASKTLRDVSLPFLFKPREYQKALMTQVPRHYSRGIFIWHRRAGKDLTSWNHLIVEAIKKKAIYYYFFPTYKQGRKALWEALSPSTGVRFLDHIPKELIANKNDTEMKITLVNGSILRVVGTDDYDCFDDRTEILTMEGWKFFKDISGKEKVATLEHGSEFVWSDIRKRVVYDYSGYMHKVKNNCMDVLVTPNHKFYVKSRKGIFKFKQISDKTIRFDLIPATCDWKGSNFDEFKKIGKKVFHMEDWCAFFGIFISDGCTYIKAPKTYRILITQKKEKAVIRILDLLNRMGISYRRYKSNISFEDKDIALYLSTFGECNEKYIPRELLELPVKHLSVLSDWMIMGDGWVNKNGSIGYSSTSKRLIDNFQEIIIKLGYSGNVHLVKSRKNGFINGREIRSNFPLYYCGVRKSKYKYFCDESGKYADFKFYTGKVYCVDAGSHVIKVRRNGYEYWSGNSIVGTNPYGCIFSEYALQDPRAWNFVRPILTENKGWAIFISCVDKDTLVITKNGLKRISTLVKNPVFEYTDVDFDVYGLGGMHRATEFYFGGKQKLLKIVTSKGYTIKVTPNHPLWNGYEWVRSDKYKVGDIIPIQRGQNIWGTDVDISQWEPSSNHGACKHIFVNYKFDEDFMWLLGLILAEGYWDDVRCVITNVDKEIIDKIKLFGFNTTTSDPVHHTNSCMELCSFIDWFGIKREAKNKRIPEKLFGMPKSYVSAFLSGYFDGDGCASRSKGSVSCTSSSEGLIDDIQTLLLNYGISSRKSRWISRPTGKVHKECVHWKLEIEGREAVLFYNDIGFHLSRKQANKKILDGKSFSGNLVPVGKVFLKEYAKGLAMGGLKRQQSLTYGKIKELLLIKPNATLQSIVDSNFYWDKIKEITVCEGEVYDFVIPQTHSFFSNGFISHNTPRGRNHMYTLYKMAEVSPEWYTEILTINKTKREDDTPVISAKDIDREREEGMFEELIQQEYNCFPSGTKIWTDMGQVPIEQVSVNDVVLSHAGRWRKVNKVYQREYYDGNVIEIKSSGSSSALVCTEEHPIRVCVPNKQIYKWLPANQIKVGDYVVLIAGNKKRKCGRSKLLPQKHGVASYVTSITHKSYSGLVYNLGVQYDNSYVAEGRVVHNCSFEGYVQGAYYSKQIEEARADNPPRITALPYVEGSPVHTAWDLGYDDSTSIWFFQAINQQFRFIDYYENCGQGWPFYINVLKNKPYVYGDHYMPHDVAVHEKQTGMTHKEFFEEFGIQPIIPVLKPKNNDVIVLECIPKVRGIFSQCWFDKVKCSVGLSSLESYHAEYNEEKKVLSNRPARDISSHACLHGDSLIALECGALAKIKNVKNGDRVWTPSGYAKVLNSGPTGYFDCMEIEMSDGKKIICTKNHKFFTTDGIVTADTLQYTHHILSGGEALCKLIALLSTVLNLGFRESITGETIGVKKVQAIFIERFGNFIMAQFPQVMKFIIKMKTLLIMIFPIWKLNSSLFPNGNTLSSGLIEENLNPQVKEHCNLQLSGIVLGKELNGTSNKDRKRGEKENGFYVFVKNVGKNLCFRILRGLSIVTPTVKAKHYVEGPELMYDLTIENHACYQANGILVSNSDAFRTFVMGFKPKGKKSKSVSQMMFERRRTVG